MSRRSALGKVTRWTALAAVALAVAGCANPLPASTSQPATRDLLLRAQERHPEVPLLVPTTLPPGYRLDSVSAQSRDGRGVSQELQFVREDLSSPPVVLCIQLAEDLQDPCGARQAADPHVVAVDALEAVWRFTPGDSVGTGAWREVRLTRQWSDLGWVS